MGLSKLHTALTELQRRRREELDRHAAALAAIDGDIWKTSSEIDLSLKGINVELIAQAEAVMYVSGLFSQAGSDRARCLSQAIDAVAARGEALLHVYFGTKVYDRWHGQDVQCTYGMVPRHGRIIFEIGLKAAVRARAKQPDFDGMPLTEEEADACVYYLSHLQQIQERREAAKVSS